MRKGFIKEKKKINIKLQWISYYMIMRKFKDRKRDTNEGKQNSMTKPYKHHESYSLPSHDQALQW